MTSLPVATRDEGVRARRWDAVLLGSGVASLVAAARMGMAGHRVLVVEEEAASRAFPGLREPFFLGGALDGGALDACLRELTLPLIERRRIAAEPLAYQIVGRDLRMDVGEPALTAEEMSVWDLAEHAVALNLTKSLTEAADAECKMMLEAPLVRLGRRIARTRPGAPGSHVRGLPAEAASPPPELRPVLDAQVRALSNLATADPPPEARARLLGSALAGGAAFSGGPPWLLGLLRKRVQSVFGEFRSLSGDFELVSVDGLPGLRVPHSSELWVGRLLVLATPSSALTEVVCSDETPRVLASDRPWRRRLAIHLRCRASAIPEGMGRRLILLPDPGGEGIAAEAITLSLFAQPDDPGSVDLIARGVLDADIDRDPKLGGDAIEARVRTLLPSSQDSMVRCQVRNPRWDDDDWLEDPSPGVGWPGDIDLRVSARPPMYRLDRAGVAGLGLEGDLLLGWRAGDAIAAELR